jgi:Tfp pilus assembly protein PilN
MKKGESLAATNQLIRFIRGDVKGEEFYDQPSEEDDHKRPAIMSCGLSLLIGVLLISVGYLFLSRQLKHYQSQLETLAEGLETMRVKCISPEIFESKELFRLQQERLYQSLLGEKLSMTCILKGLTHFIPTDTCFKRVSLGNVISQGIQGREEESLPKRLVLEGMVLKGDAYGSDDFPKILAHLNSSSFFQNIQVTYQNEINTGSGQRLDFTLTCDLK